jgi:hypothetical protein
MNWLQDQSSTVIKNVPEFENEMGNIKLPIYNHKNINYPLFSQTKTNNFPQVFLPILYLNKFNVVGPRLLLNWCICTINVSTLRFECKILLDEQVVELAESAVCLQLRGVGLTAAELHLVQIQHHS